MNINVGKDVATLKRMTVDDRRQEYVEVFQETTNARHKEWLVRRIAWRIQVQAEGDLSERARRRAAELANDADVRVTPPKGHRVATCGENSIQSDVVPDNRVPAPGGAIVRNYRGTPGPRGHTAATSARERNRGVRRDAGAMAAPASSSKAK